MVVLHRSRPRWPSPELNALYAVRAAVAARRDEARKQRRPADLVNVLDETVARFDSQLLPALHQVVARERELSRHLASYHRGDLPMPDPAVLDRLQRIEQRLRATMRECLQEAANADAALVALLQDGPTGRTVERVRSWSSELLGIHDALSALLTEPLPEVAPEVAHEGTADGSDEAADAHELRAEDVAAVFLRLTEEALRRVNNPGALGGCGLLEQLEHSVRLELRKADGPVPAGTLLQRTQALRALLVAAIEGLRPANAAPGDPEMLQYHILQGAYLQGLPNRQIMVRHSVAEATFHRHRRQGLAAVAKELREREQQLRSEQSLTHEESQARG